ncbi:adenosylcobinamide-GDP ribazoletransferase [Zhongshania guokunii]|uniref:Adenosylcobinamide-GDP ribazoletransferase n=1 Tax=Zhongshania guokunii TaxID=641783 RepID=A0ABV3U206_9GAMM
MSRQQCRYEWQVLLLAVGFLTRLPVPADPDFSEDKLNGASRYFPLVGLFVGVLAAGVYGAALAVFANSLIAILLSMVASILITGSFHEDGFADSCDGFGGGWRSEDVLRIMKDSRIGTYGTVGLISILALKAASLDAMPTSSVLAAALLWGHVFSRWVSTSYLLDLNYVRGEGKSKPLATTMPLRHWLYSGVPLLPLLMLIDFNSLIALVAMSLLFRLVFAAYLRRRIGGYTGDALGAAQQVVEILVYLAILL